MGKYESPLGSRYASEYMLELFSNEHRSIIWRKLWLSLAKAEQKLGLDISDEQIEELAQNLENIDYEVVRQREKEVRHDVMAHVYAYGLVAPKAAGIIHLGATSCYVTDNSDLVIYRDALRYIRKELVNVLANLVKFADEYKDLPTLGYTHYQPAQLVTVGKRATLWAQDFLSDLKDLDYLLDGMYFFGCRGTTGTEASFMDLFDNNEEKIDEMNKMIASDFGFETIVDVSGQTYPRKMDARILNVLASIGQSAYRRANDIRWLQHEHLLEEPFEKNQIGSSAMAYKRNPMRSERIASLSKYIISESISPAMVEATQWLERSLDDSANKRLAIPQAFMAADAILEIGINVTDGLVVYESMINKHINEELPFMATENILMEAVKRGGDRQELHEEIRELSMKAAYRVKHEGLNNNLIDLILESDKFNMLKREEISDILDPMKFVGRALEQVLEFVEEYLDPAIEPFKDVIGDVDVDSRV